MNLLKTTRYSSFPLVEPPDDIYLAPVPESPSPRAAHKQASGGQQDTQAAPAASSVRNYTDATGNGVAGPAQQPYATEIGVASPAQQQHAAQYPVRDECCVFDTPTKSTEQGTGGTQSNECSKPVVESVQYTQDQDSASQHHSLNRSWRDYSYKSAHPRDQQHHHQEDGASSCVLGQSHRLPDDPDSTASIVGIISR